jgi:hypothetical protein
MNNDMINKTADDLLLEAGHRSGMRQQIAEVLCWRKDNPNLYAEFAQKYDEAIIEELVAMFDDNIGIPGAMIEKVTAGMIEGDAVDNTGPFEPEQIKLFLGAMR